MSTYSYRPFVPFVPTPLPVARKMLELARVGPEDVVYDLGAGDGRLVIMAVKEFNAKKAVGVELRHDLVEEARGRIKKAGLEGRAIMMEEDMFEVDLSEATVVTLFLLTSVNEKLKPKLEKELRPGARVVSHEFQIPGWKPRVVATVYERHLSHTIYFYIKE